MEWYRVWIVAATTSEAGQICNLAATRDSTNIQAERNGRKQGQFQRECNQTFAAGTKQGPLLHAGRPADIYTAAAHVRNEALLALSGVDQHHRTKSWEQSPALIGDGESVLWTARAQSEAAEG